MCYRVMKRYTEFGRITKATDGFHERMIASYRRN